MRKKKNWMNTQKINKLSLINVIYMKIEIFEIYHSKTKAEIEDELGNV